MQVIKSMTGFVQPKQRLLETYECEGCNQYVERKETVIPIGPRKGEIIVANLGCKCEEIQLAKQSVLQRDRLKLNKIHQLIDTKSLINAALQKATFSNYRPTNEMLHKAKSRLIAYAKEFDPDKSSNVLLVGDYGKGKSHLAVSVTKELTERGYTCLFLSVPKLLTKIKDSYNANSDYSENEVLMLIQQG